MSNSTKSSLSTFMITVDLWRPVAGGGWNIVAAARVEHVVAISVGSSHATASLVEEERRIFHLVHAESDRRVLRSDLAFIACQSGCSGLLKCCRWHCTTPCNDFGWHDRL